ncbi:hypothetical protein BJ508DRAFT_377032 [Ascobolus immersus RN42]|uniref:ABM domain-containing protein n=1 Tax=Ascobolus immersus RN42 TaxID=1160509 RepID=A0A3N4I3H7_ASCIM|nr:hypothetical protein BJ508DRAFT_377032 [Ascobolus immersus RN42]
MANASGPSYLRGMVQLIVEHATEARNTALEMEAKFANDPPNDLVYFRFNVPMHGSGSEKIGIDEWESMDAVRSHTVSYLTEPKITKYVDQVVTILKNPRPVRTLNSVLGFESVVIRSSQSNTCAQGLVVFDNDNQPNQPNQPQDTSTTRSLPRTSQLQNHDAAALLKDLVVNHSELLLPDVRRRLSLDVFVQVKMARDALDYWEYLLQKLRSRGVSKPTILEALRVSVPRWLRIGCDVGARAVFVAAIVALATLAN